MVNAARLSYYAGQKGLTLPTEIMKRDGSKVAFDLGRVERAVESCYLAITEGGGPMPELSPLDCAERVGWALAGTLALAGATTGNTHTPDVEQVQNLVELTLMSAGEVAAATAYASYRDTQAGLRSRAEQVPPEVRIAFDLDATYFRTEAQRFTFYDKYSRFNWDLMRRETWPETVDRTIEHLQWEVMHHAYVNDRKACGHSDEAEAAWMLAPEDMRAECTRHALMDECDEAVSPAEWEELRAAILAMDVMPSMRLLAMAGPAARRNSMAIYNCSFLPISDLAAWPEVLSISMAGCGVGYSVERRHVEQLPRVARALGGAPAHHLVDDSAEGWSAALRAGLEAWFAGLDVMFDYRGIRPAGSILRTKGGRASGPEPLRHMLDGIKAIVLNRQGTTLTTLDAHDMTCLVGEAAVQGGVRRTAMIALFDYDDEDMRRCKSGPWGTWPDYRANANNSAVWPSGMSQLEVVRAMHEMMASGSGEPGIFSRSAAVATMSPERLARARRDYGTPPEMVPWGTNPCGEIVLRPYGLCNLSQAVCRAGDTAADLERKVRLATLAGTVQSLSTRFPGLRPEWARNAASERLLGVDLTAQNDAELTRDSASVGQGTPEAARSLHAGFVLRQHLRELCHASNERWARLLGIEPAAASTCNKPAGNSTELLDAASNGIHRPHAPHFLRRMLVSEHSPLLRVLKAAGAPTVKGTRAGSWVVEFVKAAPRGAPTKGTATAIEQLEFWLLNRTAWTDHNPSCTITYRMHEVVDLIAWVAKHKDRIGGLSFFPTSDHIYPQAPFEEITEAEYVRRASEFPPVDYALLYSYEHEDHSNAAQQLACLAGSCETL